MKCEVEPEAQDDAGGGHQRLPESLDFVFQTHLIPRCRPVYQKARLFRKRIGPDLRWPRVCVPAARVAAVQTIGMRRILV
jgi:hypothetical protein